MRRMRTENGVAPSKSIDAFVVALSAGSAAMFDDEAALIARLARTKVAFVDSAPRGRGGTTSIIPGGTELIVPLEGLIDVEKECARLRTELAELEKQLTSLEGRLSNAGFVERAPAERGGRASASKSRRMAATRRDCDAMCESRVCAARSDRRRAALLVACASAGAATRRAGGPCARRKSCASRRIRTR